MYSSIYISLSETRKSYLRTCACIIDMNNSDRKEGWIDCYNSSQKILLVGEGDFSFSACLARAFGTAKNMVATSYLDQGKNYT